VLLVVVVVVDGQLNPHDPGHRAATTLGHVVNPAPEYRRAIALQLSALFDKR